PPDNKPYRIKRHGPRSRAAASPTQPRECRARKAAYTLGANGANGAGIGNAGQVPPTPHQSQPGSGQKTVIDPKGTSGTHKARITDLHQNQHFTDDPLAMHEFEKPIKASTNLNRGFQRAWPNDHTNVYTMTMIVFDLNQIQNYLA